MTASQQSRPEPKHHRRITLHQIVAAVLLAAALVFVFENTRTVPIRFVGPEVTAPLWLALLITLVLGLAGGYFLSRRRQR